MIPFFFRNVGDRGTNWECEEKSKDLKRQIEHWDAVWKSEWTGEDAERWEDENTERKRVRKEERKNRIMELKQIEENEEREGSELWDMKDQEWEDWDKEKQRETWSKGEVSKRWSNEKEKKSDGGWLAMHNWCWEHSSSATFSLSRRDLAGGLTNIKCRIKNSSHHLKTGPRKHVFTNNYFQHLFQPTQGSRCVGCLKIWQFSEVKNFVFLSSFF